MKNQAIDSRKTDFSDINDRTKSIIFWLEKIEKSKLQITDFFKKYSVPFSRSQYYLYNKKFKEFGELGIRDKRSEGGNKKLNSESEAFIKGCVATDPDVSPKWLRQELAKKYNCNLSPSGITRMLRRLQIDIPKRTKGRPKIHKKEAEHSSCGGFELVVALAYHLGWPQMITNVIKESIQSLKRTKAFRTSDDYSDKEGRDEFGRFTSKYNQREDVRVNRFESVSKKRLQKNWKSMNIIRDQRKTIERKSLGILALPVVTMNGNIRSVDTALGQTLKHIAGFDYKQSTINKYLNELKYLGVSTELLKNLVIFWKKCWGSEMNNLKQGALLCYYIDGNTKAVWSSKRVKQNKVTMLGRVMGCLEHVFIHDSFGHPVYFETYSGHGPCGEYILELFEKIENAIEEVPGSRTSVTRVLIMDGASNSVKTLRAFASQKKYHYITPLDDNQWNERKLDHIGRPSRYRYGEATLREVIIELEDSQDKGYLLKTRAIKIDWDTGKRTVLLTSLPVNIVGASEVVRSYFNRWPDQELQFKSMKGTVSLNRVAGYGKQQIKDEQVVKKQCHAARRITELKKILEGPLEKIKQHEEAITKLIPKERLLRNQGEIEEGKRKVPAGLLEKLNLYAKQIGRHKIEIKNIEKEHRDHFQLLRKHQREWLRLQGKETVYKVDVELDQIVTFHRVSLANLYAYFIKYYLGGGPMSMMNILHKIIHLHTTIEETNDTRNIILDYNKKDKSMMERLSEAIKKINSLEVIGPHGKRMVFSMKGL